MPKYNSFNLHKNVKEMISNRNKRQSLILMSQQGNMVVNIEKNFRDVENVQNYLKKKRQRNKSILRKNIAGDSDRECEPDR